MVIHLFHSAIVHFSEIIYWEKFIKKVYWNCWMHSFSWNSILKVRNIFAHQN